jgi:putative endonuclease
MRMTLKSQRLKKQAQKRGRWGEWRCRVALNLTGWSVLQHGYTSQPGSGAGEIDLIARRGRVITFIEVKTRPDIKQGLEAVSADQQARITRGAERFLARHPNLADLDLRFDVMVVRPWRWPVRFADVWQLTP